MATHDEIHGFGLSQHREKIEKVLGAGLAALGKNMKRRHVGVQHDTHIVGVRAGVLHSKQARHLIGAAHRRCKSNDHRLALRIHVQRIGVIEHGARLKGIAAEILVHIAPIRLGQAVGPPNPRPEEVRNRQRQECAAVVRGPAIAPNSADTGIGAKVRHGVSGKRRNGQVKTACQ